MVNAINPPDYQILALTSGKGGVGKSICTANLALALKEKGVKVGILDADIYGSSQASIFYKNISQDFGISETGIITPLISHDIPVVSTSLLFPDNKAIIWRTPVVNKLLNQYIRGIEWADIDLLLIDFPPGTGDTHLTLFQQLEISAALLVSTAEKVALEVSARGLELLEKLSVPVFGLVDNMSYLACNDCNHKNYLFSQKNILDFQQQYSLDILAHIPLSQELNNALEDGTSMLKTYPNSQASISFRNLATLVIEKLAQEKQKKEVTITFLENSVKQKDKLTIKAYRNKKQYKKTHSAYELRLKCPCAQCKDLLNPERIPKNISFLNSKFIGNYGIKFKFSDGHEYGIYMINQLL